MLTSRLTRCLSAQIPPVIRTSPSGRGEAAVLAAVVGTTGPSRVLRRADNRADRVTTPPSRVVASGWGFTRDRTDRYVSAHSRSREAAVGCRPAPRRHAVSEDRYTVGIDF